MSTPPSHPTDPQQVLAKPGLSVWQSLMARLRANRLAMFAFRILLFLCFVALFADFIAYDKPYTCVYKGERRYPIVADYLSWVGLYRWEAELINADWAELELESAVWPPVRYMPAQIDTDNPSRGPFDKQRISDWKFWHYLGTDRDGRDVLSALIHGTRFALSIGLIAMGIATAIGIVLGSLAGFFGDDRLQLSRVGIFFVLIGLVLGLFYGFQVRSYVLRDALQTGIGNFLGQASLGLLIVIVIVWVFRQLARPFERIPYLGVKRNIWVDIILSRLIEIVSSIPTLLLLIAILAVSRQKSIYLTMALIGLMGWTGIAQYMRGEMLRTRAQEYVQAARSLGYRDLRILFRHALPNSISPVLTIVAFGVAGAIGLEAALSFLGIGLPEDTITWGRLLNGARADIHSWWLAVFPGAAVFVTITTLNLLGEGLRDALDPTMQVDQTQ